MVIVYCDKGMGWSPISYMVNLAVSLFEAELIVLDYKTPSALQKLSVLLLRRKSTLKGENLLFICPSPKELPLIFQIPNIRNRFNFIGAWVIDSFWIDRIPRAIKVSKYFDHFFITSREDIPQWQKMTQTPVTWLPWGTDALGLGGHNGKRQWDLRRVGRQPIEWNDDVITAKSCIDKNIKFKGRPELLNEQMQNQIALMTIYRQSKLILAFSNTANPTNYTHPVRSYLTGRWTDSLGCGGIVAGVSPEDSSNKELLWEGATIELGTVKREEGLVIIKDALAKWSPIQAEHNYKTSLQRLDWRWRFAEIAEVFQVHPHKLSNEIELLELKIKH